MLGCFTIANNPSGEADRLLEALAAQLSAEGVQLAGAVQINVEDCVDCAGDMDMRVLGDSGPLVRISQSLGSGSRGCRLDAGALQMAAGRVSDVLARGAALCILPKFGKQEAVGLGFRDCIAQALELEIPVLIHVPADQRAAFNEFAGDFACWIEADQVAVWCRAALHGDAA